MARIVTKAQAAVLLHISPAEVVRRIERGEIKAKKKTASKFSDWLIELPDDGTAVDEVKGALVSPQEEAAVEPPEEETPEEPPEEETPEEPEEPEPEPEKPEPVVVKQRPRPQHQVQRKEVKTNGKDEEGRRGVPAEDQWWFGN